MKMQWHAVQVPKVMQTVLCSIMGLNQVTGKKVHLRHTALASSFSTWSRVSLVGKEKPQGHLTLPEEKKVEVNRICLVL